MVQTSTLTSIDSLAAAAYQVPLNPAAAPFIPGEPHKSGTSSSSLSDAGARAAGAPLASPTPFSGPDSAQQLAAPGAMDEAASSESHGVKRVRPRSVWPGIQAPLGPVYRLRLARYSGSVWHGIEAPFGPVFRSSHAWDCSMLVASPTHKL